MIYNMRRFFTFTLAAIMMALASCSNDDEKFQNQELPDNPVVRDNVATPIDLKGNEVAINEKLKTFSWQLFADTYSESQEIKVSNPEKYKDALVSPLSLFVNLGMFQNMYGSDSRAIEELYKTLGLQGSSMNDFESFGVTMMKGVEEADKVAEFTCANSFWYNSLVQETPLSDDNPFVKKLSTVYNAFVGSVDYSKQDEIDKINAWCTEKTNGKIKEIINGPQPNRSFDFLNAVFFKAGWRNVFNPKETSKDSFSYSDGTTENIEMMHQKSILPLNQGSNYTSLALPFNSGAYEMTFILPNEEQSVDNVISTLVREGSKGQGKDCLVDLKVPKFETEAESLPLEIMDKKMNNQLLYWLAFDLYGEQTDTEIHSMQKIALKINEEGTEAAVVTDIHDEHSASDSAPQKVDFHLDRPFLYTIVETSTGCPLFIGYYGR